MDASWRAPCHAGIAQLPALAEEVEVDLLHGVLANEGLV
jgi:hypothetical protein